ncbi:MAG: hypothetical protein WCJ49_02170 [Deltaproteobacteria bacterium]
MTSNQPCQLCCKETELCNSHIIPKFITNYLKDSSATGFLRCSDSNTPNLRVQDGKKERMLCSDCEALFSTWETTFANKIFGPLNNNDNIMPFKYESWLLKFAVSVSWRVLTSYDIYSLPGISETGKALAAKALQTWRGFLLDELPHPCSFEQHMIFTSNIRLNLSDDLPPNWNQFLNRGTHMNMCHHEGHPLYIYTKMGGVTLLGFIGIACPRHWVGTKIHVKDGVIGNSTNVPIEFLGYMKERAREELSEQRKISPKKEGKIDAAYRKDPDRSANSASFMALHKDVLVFGEKAVFGKKDNET